jgi:hypothetical protein
MVHNGVLEQWLGRGVVPQVLMGLHYLSISLFTDFVSIKSPNKRVSGRLGSLSWLNRTDSGLVGLYGLNRSDPAAHAKH